LKIRKADLHPQVPTVIVFTQSDKKVDSLLTKLLPERFTEQDIKRSRPIAEDRAREHYLGLKKALVERGLRKARFAVLGGLAPPGW
jgi:hypothetical protein